jgi:hypothetical protein
MSLYTVHLYREMRHTYRGIEAESPEAAAAIARQQTRELSDYENSVEDCVGGTFAALVDIAGDEDYRHSQMIEYEPERARKAANLLLEALKEALPILEARATTIRLMSGGICRSEAYDKALVAIAQAEGGAQ